MTTLGVHHSGGRRQERSAAKAYVAGLCFAAATVANIGAARAETDSVWYLRLGAGAVEQKGLAGGPAFGFGWRYVVDHIGLDVSLFNFVLTKQGATFDNLTGSWLRVGALYYLSPVGNSSLYAGAAAAWGLTSSEINDVHYSNAGLNFGLSLGYETMRTSSIRLFLQADADLPAYMSHGYVPTEVGNTLTLVKDSAYTPAFSLSIGIGAGRPKAPPEPPKTE